MTKNDYIEKITQNLEHLTKDELKDVSILTTAQLGVRSKFAERQQLEHEIANLTPRLQQQALPVVPEDVAKWIEDLKSKGYSPFKNPVTYGEAISDLSDESLEKILTWISQHQEEFMRAWLDGYTVEKPQLFYLKHIDMSKSDKFYDYFLEKRPDGVLVHGGIQKGKLPKLKCILKLTQQEIDSMQTGSYEQIEVVK